MVFVIGWNTPGYLPEMEPMEFNDFTLAKSALSRELETVADDDPIPSRFIYAAALVLAWDVDQLRDRGGECTLRIPFDMDYWIQERQG